MLTEFYCTRADKLLVKEVWMVTDVYGKIKRMKIDQLKERIIKVTKDGLIYTTEIKP